MKVEDLSKSIESATFPDLQKVRIEYVSLAKDLVDSLAAGKIDVKEYRRLFNGLIKKSPDKTDPLLIQLSHELDDISLDDKYFLKNCREEIHLTLKRVKEGYHWPNIPGFYAHYEENKNGASVKMVAGLIVSNGEKLFVRGSGAVGEKLSALFHDKVMNITEARDTLPKKIGKLELRYVQKVWYTVSPTDEFRR